MGWHGTAVCEEAVTVVVVEVKLPTVGDSFVPDVAKATRTAAPTKMMIPVAATCLSFIPSTHCGIGIEAILMAMFALAFCNGLIE
jgi:hypothetical protein